MRRPHRRAHRLIWPILTLSVLLLAAGALALRPAGGGPTPSNVEVRR